MHETRVPPVAFKVKAAWPLPPDLLVGKVERGQVVEN